MSATNGAYRWWENYLVRYLMPSIAGAVIVNWLVTAGDADLQNLLLLNVGNQGLQTPTLVLLFLYGNLFCYISSYPILGFHVTRVIDFEQNEWRMRIYDGYVSTLLLGGIVLLVTTTNSGASNASHLVPFAAVAGFGAVQLYRIKRAMALVSIEGVSGQVSKITAYAYTLAKRRGVAEELHITKLSSKDQEKRDSGDKFDEETEWQKRSIWRREFIDTYRHMREHGNSAFIFLLEVTLAGLCYLLLIGFKSEGAVSQLSALGVLFALWALPAMFVHLIGQHIEHRFSWYDRRTNTAPTKAKKGAGSN